MAENKGIFSYFVGVDVGTGSTRAMLMRNDGKRMSTSSFPIKTWSPPDLPPDHYEQSSVDIWENVCKSVKEVTSGHDKSQIKGVGFDATCSLVVLDKGGAPLSVSTTCNKDQNVILWMDHRAIEQAEFINGTYHPVLKYVGGKVSPEMEMPKILWLKQAKSNENWSEIGHFMDLADFLTYRATNSLVRSFCCLVCKWNFVGFEDKGLKLGWCTSFLESIGLSDLTECNFSKIGNQVFNPGQSVGVLTSESACELGLNVGTPVATAMIDAHAGGIGMIGPILPSEISECDITQRIGMICGTSTCHMVISKSPIYASGIWGPYFSAMVPGFHLNEAGQSAAGKLIDFIIETHHACKDLTFLAREHEITVYEELERIIEQLAIKLALPHSAFLTRNYHVLPDFHGNRSPLARADMKGMICGLELNREIEDLAILYLSTIQALAYSSRHIIEELNENGHDITVVFMCGGLTRNRLYVRTHADVLGRVVLINDEEDSVLKGSCLLATVAAGYSENIEAAMQSLTSVQSVVKPDPNTRKFHDQKYEVYMEMSQAQLRYIKLMKSV